ncbi:MAG: hypothetical protein ACRDN0_23245, partial [Trebonia sp.]
PVVGALLLGAVSVICIVGLRLTNGLFSLATGQPGVLQPQWAPAFGWMAGFGGTGLALMYLAVSAAGIAGLWRHVNRTKLVVAGAAGILVALGAIFGSVYKAASPVNSVPWALGIWIVLGVLWAFIVLRRRTATPAASTAAASTAPAGTAQAGGELQ